MEIQDADDQLLNDHMDIQAVNDHQVINDEMDVQEVGVVLTDDLRQQIQELRQQIQLETLQDTDVVMIEDEWRASEILDLSLIPHVQDDWFSSHRFIDVKAQDM